MNQPIKYKDLTAYSEKIGGVTIGGIPLQLCDYVEFFDHTWCAVAYLHNEGEHDRKILKESGIQIKTLKGHLGKADTHLAYVPESTLEKAVPRFDDEDHTDMLIKRLKKELHKLNSTRAHA